ncbi:MAG: autotransporter domain-containing protein [Verrucomicrobia bacterium]|nr:autotransporter domain-containing protein [Verrucomicrobiota bacterium]
MLNLNNEVNGGFTFSAGIVQLNSSDQFTSGVINIQSHNPAPDLDASARLVLVGAPGLQPVFINTMFADSTLTIAGTVTDNGRGLSVKVAGPGTVIFTGIGSGLTINGAFTIGSIASDPSIPDGQVIIQNGARLSSSFGSITNATLRVTGAGSTWTNNSDLNIGAESLSFGSRSGTLTIQNGGNVSNVNGAIIDGAVAVTGPGSVWTNSGTLSVGENADFFSFSNTSMLEITNGATVNAAATTVFQTGTLEIGGNFTLNSPLTIAGGTVRAVADTIFPNTAKLDTGGAIFDPNGFSLTLSGSLSGPGGITKISPGTLILTGNNSFFGGTVIEAGTLVAGTPALTQEVSQALGNGDVFLMGGTLRTPNLDPLTINITRNYTQAAGGTLALGVAGLNGRDYDHIQVGGNASLNGTLALSSLDNFRPARGYAFEVVYTQGTRNGEFAQINDSFNNNPNLQRIDLYAPNGVVLVYLAGPQRTTPLEEMISTPLPPVNPDKPLSANFLLAALNPTAEQLTSMFEISFSGTNTQRFNLDDRMEQIQEGSTGFVSPLLPASMPATADKELGKQEVVPPVFTPGPTNRWGVWVNGWGDFVSVNGDNFAKGYDFTTGGVSVGIDYRIMNHLAIGVFGTYAHTWTDLNPGDVDVNTGRGGLYATYWNQGFYVNGSVFAGYNSYDTGRQALTGGLASGSTSGYEVSTFLETGYEFRFGNFNFSPVGAVQYTNAHIDGFAEKGSFSPLEIHSDSEESWRTDLGVRASYTWHFGNILVFPTLRTVWEHEYKYSALPITFSTTDFQDASATTFGPGEGQDSAIINAGAAIQWTDRIATYLGYQGQLGRGNYNANGVTGTISFCF